jgi:hypothetical protein
MKHIIPFLFTTALLSAVCFTSTESKAQNTIGFFTTSFINLPDTAVDGDSAVVGIVLQNFSDSVTYSPNYTVDIIGYIDTGAAVIPLYFGAYQGFILPSDTVVLQTLYQIRSVQNQGVLRIGGNVIVVWPIPNDPNFGPNLDTISQIIFVQPMWMGLSDHEKEINLLRVFPIPSKGPIQFTNRDASNPMQFVEVLDLTGKVVFAHSINNSAVDLSHLPKGMYLLRSTMKNGESQILRIVLE